MGSSHYVTKKWGLDVENYHDVYMLLYTELDWNMVNYYLRPLWTTKINPDFIYQPHGGYSLTQIPIWL